VFVKDKDDEEDASKDDSKSPDDKQDDKEDDSDDTSDEDEEDLNKEDEEGDKEDLLRQYSKDPASVPKELRPVIKKLLGSYTRKMQEAALVTRQASAFNQLVVDPEFRKWVEDRKAGILSKSKSKKSDDDSDDEEDDEDKPLTKKEMRKILASQKDEENASKQEVAMLKEATQFKKDNPDWEVYKEEMLVLLERNPRLSYEEAYILAGREDRDKITKKESLDSKKRANIHKPNRTQGKDVKKKGKVDFNTAYEMAKEKLGLK
jgi:hypothetical protein